MKYKSRFFMFTFMLLTTSAYSLDNTQVATIAQVALDLEQDESTIPGAVTAIADDDSVIWTGKSNCDEQYESSGFACPDSVVNTTDQFRIGSETKTYTGTVILKMIDDGYLNLTDTLDSLAPFLDIPNAGSITVENLLQMTSTIPDYLNAPALYYGSDTDLTINDQYVIQYGQLEITPPDAYIMATNSQDRTSGMSYSNTNFAILALIAQQTSCDMPDFTSCQTIEQLISHYVFEPLALNSTIFPGDDQFSLAHASGYVMIESGKEITGTASLESDDANELIDSFTFLNPKLPWAAGAIISVLDDQIIWARQLVKNNQSLLSASMQSQRLDDTVAGSVAGIPARYGLAVYHMNSDYNGSEFTGHSGAIFGFTSSLFYNKETDLFYAVDVNQYPAWQTARDFLWQIDKGIRFSQDQNGNCTGSPQPVPSTCTGLSVRTSSLTIPSGNSLIIDPSQVIYTGYNTSDCSTDSTTGEMTCTAENNTAPTLVFYGHHLEGIQIDSGTLTLESGAILQCSGRDCSAIATTGSPVLNIYGTITTEGTGSQAIKGSSGNETVNMYSGASVSSDIDLGAGNNELVLEDGASFTGNVLLSTPDVILSGGTGSLSVGVSNNQVTITDAQKRIRRYTQNQSLTEVTIDNDTISSETLLIPVDIDNNGLYDLVVYQSDDLNSLALKVSTSLFDTHFSFASGKSSGVFGPFLLVILLLGGLFRYRRIVVS
ncbi:D-alanyl-D-alanine carboxypeptidase precursor [Vibrio aerogenes CECT 7868]|uniref:D-alanyl-D-alanine carboxypeptidase n=1 Tax=Vibrio aerogenes CECT 7868 TaxID=1216006 RepID=A0A1M5ZQ04_9VIBR|nr:serine hydrolase domain-containing protein [Vibrio aerogenes]SHI26013.1 D-alanyl-D-alanine carboxypeptidase precursor [Vibrio aerogenes CECT 7868]